MELNDARTLAKGLMREHGVGTWGFEFDRAVRRFGAARFRTQKITLSKELTLRNTEAHVRETVLHEIAHVLAGAQAGHGLAWKLKAIELGIAPNRCYSTDEVEAVPLRYQATCPACKKVYNRARRPNPRRTFYCGKHNTRGNKLLWVDTKTDQPVELFGQSKFPKRTDPWSREDIIAALREAIENGS